MDDFLTVTESMLRRCLPRRTRTAHKGDFGRVLLLCGARGYTGAPALAAMAAARTGAGLIYVGVPRSVYPIVAGKLLEPMVFPLPDEEDGALSARAVPEILERLKTADACLIGCGLGAGAARVLTAVLQNAVCPVVIDADGINALAGHIDILRGAACPVVLTPHEGEARRLCPDLSADRPTALRQLQALTGATVLYKGWHTLIGDGAVRYLNACGNPGLATGGSGDVLSGILVSLLGQGLAPVEAAAVGAYLHGTAADRCAERLGEYGLLPSDLLDELPRLLITKE